MKFIAYDLGTGGVKASLYGENLTTLAKSFIEYPTSYSQNGTYHEQKPSDWWNGVINSTRVLLQKSNTDGREIACVAISGHSCVAIPLDKERKPLLESVPIWSDQRAVEDARCFFAKVDEREWYMRTGNGFPVACYYLFKLMWLKRNRPELYKRIYKVVGSKDYINLMLTGEIYTDYSYASSSGAYALREKTMCAEYIQTAGLDESIFPQITASHTLIGHLTPEASLALGLPESTVVACGGVDNACMAMGAVGSKEGAVYTSLGSSSWIPVNSKEPVLDSTSKPYVFAHIDENMFTSAYSIFAGGSSLRWVGETICKDLTGPDIYARMDELAAKAPLGANGILFNPSLAGGTSQDKSVHIRGGYLGLHLGTTREDLIRAAMEGIALNLRMSLDLLKKQAPIAGRLLFCGGGSKSAFWMQMFADVFDMEVIKTNVDQDAASLGAAAVCARAMGVWKDYTALPTLHIAERVCYPDAARSVAYQKVYHTFCYTNGVAAELGEYMYQARLY